MTDRIEVIDRLSLLFHAARALEYAIGGAPMDEVPREALLGAAISLADRMGDWLYELDAADRDKGKG